MIKTVMSATATPKSKISALLQARKQMFITMGTALAGFAAGIPVSLAFLLSNASPVTARVVQVTPASAVTSCTQPVVTPSSVSGGHGGQVLGESTDMMPTSGQGGGNAQTPPPFVQQMVGGGMSATGTIGETGPGSTNVVTSNQTETTTVTNNNTVTVTNINSQNASTGSTTVSGSTNGGSAESGDATNSNSTSLDLNITN